MADLTRFPRPHLAVDLVVLTLGERLGVVVLRRDDGTATLPGRFVRERHRIVETAHEVADLKLGLNLHRNERLEQIGLFDAPDRDQRAWTVSVSLLLTLSSGEADHLAPGTEVLPLRGDSSRGRRVTTERLAYDHDEMVTTALRRARRRYERSPDPLGLVQAPFTMSELRRAHEAVLGEALKRDTFNRRMQPFLVPATDRRGEPMLSETGGRPAQLFRPMTRKDRDPEAGPFPLPRA